MPAVEGVDLLGDRQDVKPVTAKERVWLLGVPLLGESGRALLGKLAKSYGEEVLAEVLAEATIEKPVEAKSWITAACDAKAKRRAAMADGLPAEMRDDPRPQWAIDAGFGNRFEANNARCYEHNAHQFRGGKRITEAAS